MPPPGMPAPGATIPDRTPRRQSRGLARIESILDAATTVIACQGLDRATTNAIAAEAGISPGSLYQYFSDKNAICAALAQRYADGLAGVYATALAGVDAHAAPTAEVVSRIVGTAVRYKSDNKAFVPLFGRTDVPALQAIEDANARFEAEMISLLAARNPSLPRAQVETAALMVFTMVRGTLASIGRVTGSPESDAAELATAVTAYLGVKGVV